MMRNGSLIHFPILLRFYSLMNLFAFKSLLVYFRLNRGFLSEVRNSKFNGISLFVGWSTNRTKSLFFLFPFLGRQSAFCHSSKRRFVHTLNIRPLRRIWKLFLLSPFEISWLSVFSVIAHKPHSRLGRRYFRSSFYLVNERLVDRKLVQVFIKRVEV